MDNSEVVARNLRRLRVGLDLSQEALGLKAGIDRTYVGRVERGLENPTVAVLGKLAKAMRVPISELFVTPKPGDGRPKPLKGGRRPRRKLQLKPR